ncbi:hypothetical protein B0H13DRAFT_2345570 [Mycena leptocephala]|nr:hypothetical protein B0H13DRAFT_2345570 [Mycena leptocephala]
MRALTWTPESMPDPWVEFEGASSLSSFKCELRVVVGGRKEARVRASIWRWGGVAEASFSLLPRQHLTPKPPPSSHPPIRSYSALLALHLQMYSTILPAPHVWPSPRRCPVCATLATRMRTASTAHVSAFPKPSRTIFALVVQACFPSPSPCLAPAVHVVLPVLAHSCAIRSISLLSRSVCDPHGMAPLSPAVWMCIPSAPVSPPTPPDPLCRSYLRLAEPSQHVSYPTSIQIVPPPVFLLSLALRLVLASARRSHSLDSAS